MDRAIGANWPVCLSRETSLYAYDNVKKLYTNTRLADTLAQHGNRLPCASIHSAGAGTMNDRHRRMTLDPPMTSHRKSYLHYR